MSSVTFNSVDFLDSRSVEQAVGILWAAHRQAKQCVELFGQSESEVREQFSLPRTFTLIDPNTDTIVNEQGEEVPPPTKIQPQGFYRGNTKEFIEAMENLISKHGSTTLEDTAQTMGISLDTARAFLRNAGRTNRAHKTGLSFAPRWNADKRCNDYLFKNAKEHKA